TRGVCQVFTNTRARSAGGVGTSRAATPTATVSAGPVASSTVMPRSRMACRPAVQPPMRVTSATGDRRAPNRHAMAPVPEMVMCIPTGELDDGLGLQQGQQLAEGLIVHRGGILGGREVVGRDVVAVGGEGAGHLGVERGVLL